MAVNKPTYGVLFWAVTVVNSPREMKNVRMAVGSNSASMWWLNGKEAVILSGDRRMVMDDCVSKRLTLNKGRNVIRGAVINGPGLSDFCVRFIDENGEPIKDITLNLEKRWQLNKDFLFLASILEYLKFYESFHSRQQPFPFFSRSALRSWPGHWTANPTSTIPRPSWSAMASSTPSAPAAAA